MDTQLLLIQQIQMDTTNGSVAVRNLNMIRNF